MTECPFELLGCFGVTYGLARFFHRSAEMAQNTTSVTSPASTSSTSAPALTMDLATVASVIGLAAESGSHGVKWISVNGKQKILILRSIAPSAINQETRVKSEMFAVKENIATSGFATVEGVGSSSYESKGGKTYIWMMIVDVKDVPANLQQAMVGIFEAAVVKCVRSAKRESKKEGKGDAKETKK